LTEFMLGFYGTLHCVELQKLEIVGYENPCHAIVEALAKKLEELLAGRRIFRPVNAGTDWFLICWKGGGSPCLNYPRKKYNHFVAGSATESRD